MIRSGWRRYKASFWGYFIGGFFAILGGINVDLVETLAYMICSILAAISGIGVSEKA